MTKKLIYLTKQKIIPQGIDQFHYLKMIVVAGGSIIVLSDELFSKLIIIKSMVWLYI